MRGNALTAWIAYFPDDTINCSNLASSNRRIHSRVRDASAKVEGCMLHMSKDVVLRPNAYRINEVFNFLSRTRLDNNAYSRTHIRDYFCKEDAS